MHIVDLQAAEQVEQAARLLVEAFGQLASGYPTLDIARDEVEESLQDGRISRVATDGAGTVLGWIAAIPEYDGHVWELHPLVVRGDRRGQGIGRALVRDLEGQVAARGGGTLMLGTDDEQDQTTLAGRDLYPDPLDVLRQIQNRHRHPYEFYQKLGFVLVGVIPDANGFGKPDILMAKRVPPTD